MQVIPAGIFFLCLLFIPESPRYLVAKGKEAEAEKILSRLFGQGQGAGKVAEIRASLAVDHQPKLSDVLDPVTRKLRPILWAGLVLAVFQQLVGINIVFYYGSVLWQSVGFTEADSLKINILSGTLSILACLLAIGLIDKIGRKPLLLIGSVGMAVTLGLLTWCFSTASIDASGALHLSGDTGLIALVSANAYVVFFNLSWGPVMWVMLGEMFPNQMRGSASGHLRLRPVDRQLRDLVRLPDHEEDQPAGHLRLLRPVRPDLVLPGPEADPGNARQGAGGDAGLQGSPSPPETKTPGGPSPGRFLCGLGGRRRCYPAKAPPSENPVKIGLSAK